MALTEDSRVLLQLLLGRGKSYGDIADLLGVTEDEVRRRAHGALTEINGSDPDRDANLTDYLLGQADPIERADVARRIADDPATAETASSLSDQLSLLVPGADLPRQASGAGGSGKEGGGGSGKDGGSGKGAPRRRRSSTTPATKQPSRRSFTGSLNAPQRRLIALVLAAGLLVTVIVLLIAGAFNGDDGESVPEPAPTTAVLRPVADETGKGKVVFGFSGASLAANLDLKELEPNSEDESYALWLVGSAGAFPINQSKVDDAGTIAGQIQINEAVICLIAADVFPEVRLSRVDDAAIEELVRQSQEENDGTPDIPRYTGKTVSKGLISMPQDAKEQIVSTCTAAGSPSQ